MSIVCGITARVGDTPDAAFEAAHALAQRAPLGPLHRIELDAERDPAGVLMRIAAEQRADLLVVAGRYPGEPITRIAHESTVPVLVVRDPTPFVRWGFQRAPLRAVFGWDDTTTTAAALAPVAAMRRAGPVDVEVVQGEHLLDRVGRAGVDLVIAGITHQRHGIRRLSSVAEHVLGEATTSVMLVPMSPGAKVDAPDIRVVLYLES